MHKVRYTGLNTNYGPSPAVWGSMPDRYRIDPAEGFYWFDDFSMFLTADSGWATVGTGAGTPVQVATKGDYGVIDLLTGGSDNNEAYLCGCNNLGTMVQIATGRKVWFEARVRPLAIAEQGLCVGLFRGGASAPIVPTDVLLDNTGICNDQGSFVGFRAGMHASVMTVHGVFNTYVNGSASNEVTAVSGISVPTADTWYKLGMYFDGARMHWFVDGVEAAASATHPALEDATAFPNDLPMLPLLGVKTGEDAAKHMYIDWIGIGADRP